MVAKWLKYITLLSKKLQKNEKDLFPYILSVYKQPVLRPLKYVATFEAQKSLLLKNCIDYAFSTVFWSNSPKFMVFQLTKIHGILSKGGQPLGRREMASICLCISQAGDGRLENIGVSPM